MSFISHTCNYVSYVCFFLGIDHVCRGVILIGAGKVNVVRLGRLRAVRVSVGRFFVGCFNVFIVIFYELYEQIFNKMRKRNQRRKFSLRAFSKSKTSKKGKLLWQAYSNNLY